MNAIELNDLPYLREESLRVFRWLLAKYPNIEIPKPHTQEPIEFPIRWKTEQMGQIFEWVISDMGSVTLRLGGLEGNRRNPAPIFYLSLRKGGREVTMDRSRRKSDSFPRSIHSCGDPKPSSIVY